ncbi:hypothetical protein HHK36_018978 [Tetracentron sinense]|uniref:Rab-GAP TBC domain-containing protein n=1 Tax=Tetracentron sinense TaxID=13715 RepID=A0A834YT76_TETSI|nr:hypothetical protein HHK36_018978 [Tetracentron sinense]
MVYFPRRKFHHAIFGLLVSCLSLTLLVVTITTSRVESEQASEEEGDSVAEKSRRSKIFLIYRRTETSRTLSNRSIHHPKMKENPLISFEHKRRSLEVDSRDTYGFAVRPQHLQRYREYANIYKEEEEERSDRWTNFLERQAESAQLPINGLSKEEDNKALLAKATGQEAEAALEKGIEEDDSSGRNHIFEDSTENVPEKEVVTVEKETKTHKVQIWAQIRPSLGTIEHMMSFRVKKRKNRPKDQDAGSGNLLPPIEDARPLKGAFEEDSEEEFYDVDRTDPIQDAPSSDVVNAYGAAIGAGVGVSSEPFFPWKEELECLVHGGVPMALRGELWQAFVGVRARRVERYYQDLLAPDANTGDSKEHDSSVLNNSSGRSRDNVRAPEKWKGQIEKDLPRTFPGHPALDEDGRNALRRLLTAYARHNPSVGYCQAMNFFAGLLLLLMPEENAFWALMGIIDNYFDGYYSEEMIESQVDQLVFEEQQAELFSYFIYASGAVNHLDYLGVQVAWVTGPWFLSIFMNMLPWESGQVLYYLPSDGFILTSVLRVWDVLLFEGNRVMLFRTAFALMELYGPALVTTKDAGDAVTLLQSLAGSTFDSSQLVLSACMGYQAVNEARLQHLREKHRPAVLAAVEERSKGLRVWRDSQGLASKLYSFKHDPASLITEANTTEGLGDMWAKRDISHLESGSTNLDKFPSSITGDVEVVWLKVELCRLMEEKKSATLRAEELETALMEMVKQDNRRQLSAGVEQLEQEVAELQKTLTDKQEQEHIMLEVLMRIEQDQRVTEDARRFAEQDAAAQKNAAHVLQEKYEEAMASLEQMEKQVVMAESMLEATLQYQSGQVKVQPSPRSAHPDFSQLRVNQESTQDLPTRKIGIQSASAAIPTSTMKINHLAVRDVAEKLTSVEDPSEGEVLPLRDGAQAPWRKT